jgi:hypothetical protein
MDGPAFLIIWLFVGVLMSVIAGAIASVKGRSVIGWGAFGFVMGILFGLLLGWLPCVIVACQSNLKEEQAHRDHQERENRRLREQLRQERLKVESFQQHTLARLDAHDHHLGVNTRQTYTALPNYPAPAAAQLEGPSLMNEPGPLDRALLEASEPSPLTTSASPSIDGAAPLAGVNGGDGRQWHYERDGQALGPVAEPALLQLLRTGQITASTLVWTQELGDWRAAGQIRAFRPYMQPRT